MSKRGPKSKKEIEQERRRIDRERAENERMIQSRLEGLMNLTDPNEVELAETLSLLFKKYSLLSHQKDLTEFELKQNDEKMKNVIERIKISTPPFLVEMKIAPNAE